MTCTIITPADSAPADAEWRTIPVNVNYEISSYGQIRRLTVPSSHRYPAGTPVIPRLKRNGYYSVALWKDGRATHHSIHRLVAITFLPASNGHVVVRHIDDVKANCHIGNLTWGSHKDNSDDCVRNGRIARGERVNTAKLTADQVREIRATSGKQRDVAKQFGVTQASISTIKRRESWRHIPD